jgi:hypothetical protein
MKKVLLLTFIISALCSCKNSSSPKDVAKEFIQAVYSGDAATASGLATEKTKATVSDTKPVTPSISAEESFSLATLTEAINGNTAEVKNELINLSLQKEGNGWMVNATTDLVANINNRQMNLMALKTKWETLLKEYDARLQLAKDYIAYKKGQGVLSPQMQTLEEITHTLSVKTTWDKEKILLYVQRQKQLAEMIDKSLEPSYTASADISMNYILQLSNANDRIKTAQGEYQTLAEKTPSTIYPTLSVK